MNSFYSLLFSILLINVLGAQNYINGTISDNELGTPLIGAAVVITETGQGTVSGNDGSFSIETEQKFPLTLEISFLGYIKEQVVLNENNSSLNIGLLRELFISDEIVVSASRREESIMDAPVTVERMDAEEIQSVASGNYYESLDYFKGVDIVTTSLGMHVINMRGFNTTLPTRIVQLVDGMDNQSPGLNYSMGSMFAIPDIDMDNIEVITGPASALYGPNAFQGVVNLTSKNPYDYQGISFKVKGGERLLSDNQLRVAKAIGEKQKFAFKLVGSYMRAEDWVANDPVANRYGAISTTEDFDQIVNQLQFNPNFTQAERDQYAAINNYLGANPIANPGEVFIQAPGYMESELDDSKMYNAKLATSLHYRFKPNLELMYQFRFGTGSAIHQGTNRYKANNVRFQQHNLELSGDNFLFRAYTSNYNIGDSYDLGFTAINLSSRGIGGYIPAYLGEYFNQLAGATQGFMQAAQQADVDAATIAAEQAAQNAWLTPNTQEFDNAFNSIVSNPDLTNGSLFKDRSSLQHIDAQYNFDIDFLDLIVGASFRNYIPRTFGTMFYDTLVNRNDTLQNGLDDPDAKYINLNTWEFGAFAQASKKLFDNKLTLLTSLRVDKHMNFDVQFSPRFGLVYSPNKNHSIRVSAQSAFRSPTLQNQYFLLNLGPITLLGNVDGQDNLYTLASMQAYFQDLAMGTGGTPTLLQTTTLKPLKPEQVKSIELGYRGEIKNKLSWDIVGFYSLYSQFLGNARVVRPGSGASVDDSSGELALQTGDFTLYQIAVNAEENVSSYGVYGNLKYTFLTNYSLGVNYAYNDLNTSKLTSDIIPAFNTPKHQFGVQFNANKIWKGLGLNAAFKWQDQFEWQSSFGDGNIAAFHTLDVQASYEIPEIYSTLRFGASNIYNKKYRQAYGSPEIGRLVYGSWTFDFGF